MNFSKMFNWKTAFDNQLLNLRIDIFVLQFSLPTRNLKKNAWNVEGCAVTIKIQILNKKVFIPF